MLIVDRALAARAEQDDPIRVGLVGAGFSGRNIAHQILRSFPSMHLAAIANRTVASARDAYTAAGASEVRRVETVHDLERAITAREFAVAEDPSLLTRVGGIDVIIEATGTIEHAAAVALSAIENRKHLVVANVELDATLGPILKAKADREGVVYTNSDGDEPAVAMNMIRFVRSIGLRPVVAGNLKGFHDRYRTPETQREFAARTGQKPKAVTSFADGTKLSMELTVLANATGFGVARGGPLGPELEHVDQSPEYFAERLGWDPTEGTVDAAGHDGVVDFLVGAAPGSGAFVLGHTQDPVKARYLEYLKMGPGPLYAFYTPFHLPQLEAPLTAARACLFGDAAVAPLGAPVCDAVATAKRDLRAGEVLDGLGGYATYALIRPAAESLEGGALPVGLSEGCRLLRDIGRDDPIRYADVELPRPEGLGVRLRAEQDRMVAPREIARHG